MHSKVSKGTLLTGQQEDHHPKGWRGSFSPPSVFFPLPTLTLLAQLTTSAARAGSHPGWDPSGICKRQREKGRRMDTPVPSPPTKVDSLQWPEWAGLPTAAQPPTNQHSQKPSQTIKKQRERHLQGCGEYYDGVYFPAILSIQLCANIGLSSDPQGSQAAGCHQNFTVWL